MKKNTSTLKARKRKPSKNTTHLRILKAARKIFAQYAYHAASIRMIGKEADIDHPLISYYYPSKAILFEAVLADILQEWHKANEVWFDGLDQMGPKRGLALFIDRMIAYNRIHHHAAKVFLLNVVQAQSSDNIPGYNVIQTFFEQTTKMIKDRIRMQASDHDIEIFRQSFNTLALSYLGAKSYYATILGMDPESQTYENWVKKMLMDLFLPRLKCLMFGDKKNS